MAKATPVQIEIAWKYKNFPLQMKLFEVRPEKSFFISETQVVSDLSKTPATTLLKNPIPVEPNSSKPAVLVIENNGDKDFYFFAAPHEVHPAPASAGHFFECLCVGRVFKIPQKTVWYRIVRINLNSDFQNVKNFKIEHQIFGLTEKEAKTKFAERLYNY